MIVHSKKMMQKNPSAVTKLAWFPYKLLVIYVNTLQEYNIQHSMILLTQINLSRLVYEKLKKKVKQFAGGNTIA